MRLLWGNAGPGWAFSGVGDIWYLDELVLCADADNNVLDAVVSAGLLCWDDPFFFDDLLLFPCIFEVSLILTI